MIHPVIIYNINKVTWFILRLFIESIRVTWLVLWLIIQAVKFKKLVIIHKIITYQSYDHTHYPSNSRDIFRLFTTSVKSNITFLAAVHTKCLCYKIYFLIIWIFIVIIHKIYCIMLTKKQFTKTRWSHKIYTIMIIRIPLVIILRNQPKSQDFNCD